MPDSPAAEQLALKKTNYSKIAEANLDGAFAMALRATNYPALPRPSIGTLPKAPALISMETYKITVDPSKFPDALDTDIDVEHYLDDLTWHEVDHYVFCPGSGENAAYLLAKAIKGLNKPTPEKAKAVFQFFVDVVDDVHRYNKPSYKKMPIRDDGELLPAYGRRVEAGLHKKSKLDRIFLRTMEKGMGRDLGLGPVDDELENYADRAYELISNCSAGINKNNWGKKIYRLGKLLSPILDQENEASQFQKGEGGGDVKVEPQKTNLSAAADELSPDQFKTLIDALSDEKTNDDSKDRDAARDGEKQEGESQSKFKLPPESLKAWYRSRVRQRVRIEESSIKFSGGKEIKEPVQFRIEEDPIEELDLLSTVANFGMPTPATLSMGLAKKYRREGTEYEKKVEPATPNILIVQDASGSMEGHKHGSKTEMAALSGYEVAYHVVGHGALVGVINSSKNSYCLPPTKNLSDIEDYLTVWQNDDTVLPTQQLEEELELFPKETPVHTIVVTDTAVHNLHDAMPAFKKAVARGGLSVFAIKSKKNSKSDNSGIDTVMVAAFKAIGAEFHYIEEIANLEGLMLQSVKR